MPHYPTKEEILKTEYKFKPEILRFAKLWKKVVWNKWRHSNYENKETAIMALIYGLALLYKKPVRIITASDYYCYYAKNKTINIPPCWKTKPSIISSLHELGHHITKKKGANELGACRFSVWLFKKIFPKAFKRLHWDGHKLIQ